MKIELTLNGRPVAWEIAPNDLLLDYLRERQGLTGTKRSCEVEVCGACTVLVDGEPVSACTFLAWEVRGRSVTTIEGLTERPQFPAIAEAFLRRAAVQCGFCTPGMLLTVASMLARERQWTDEEIREALSGNLCRCTGYQGILEAVRDVVGSRP